MCPYYIFAEMFYETTKRKTRESALCHSCILIRCRHGIGFTPGTEMAHGNMVNRQFLTERVLISWGSTFNIVERDYQHLKFFIFYAPTAAFSTHRFVGMNAAVGK